MGVMNDRTREGEAARDTFVPTCVRQSFCGHVFVAFVCVIRSHGVCALISWSFVAVWEVLNAPLIQREEFSYIPDFCKKWGECRGEGFCRQKGFFVNKKTEVLAHLREILSMRKKYFFWMCEGNRGWAHRGHISSGMWDSAAGNLVALWWQERKVLCKIDPWQARCSRGCLGKRGAFLARKSHFLGQG